MSYASKNRSLGHWRAVAVLAVMVSGVAAAAPSQDVAGTESGESIYRYYCYQCHGYAGDARTLASRGLSPPPRDFTRVSVEDYPAQRIVTAVLQGRPGTAMMAFDAVLTEAEARAVARYIRQAFMSENRRRPKYHSVANGWTDHERYAGAFGFVDGRLSLDTPWESLGPAQQRGRRLYESACVSCHDAPDAADSNDVVFELRAVSYPRRHFSHRGDATDLVSAASPYAVHDLAPEGTGLSDAALAGRELYAENCAFCHAADGTGRNWIGSFLDPRPRDFTDPDFRLMRDAAALEQRILAGIPGTSMPAWRDVLGTREVEAIVAYLQQAFGAEK